MPTIDEILLLLRDGKWHNIKEIAQKTSLPESKTKIAFEFLGEYNFVRLNKNTKRAKIQPSIAQFIEEIQRLEKEPIH